MGSTFKFKKFSNSVSSMLVEQWWRHILCISYQTLDYKWRTKHSTVVLVIRWWKWVWHPLLSVMKAFWLVQYLMKPYPQRTLDNIKSIFNYDWEWLNRGRKMVKCVFGSYPLGWLKYFKCWTVLYSLPNYRKNEWYNRIGMHSSQLHS